MTPNTPVTSAAQRRVQWKLIDRALAPYSTDSLIVLLQAALTSPDSQRLNDHLLLLLTRVLRTPHRPGRCSGADDLPLLVEAAMQAARRGIVTGRDPSDLRARVRGTAADDQLLVHPGQLTHPLLWMRSWQLTALATDEPLCATVGFGIGDVLELALRITDRALNHLTPAWPEPVTEDTHGHQVACHLTPAEVEAARPVAMADPVELVPDCRHPERAACALTWLTRPIKDMPLRYDPEAPLLGAVLALTAHGRRLPVPAGAATDALAPAVARLLTLIPPAEQAPVETRLQELTVSRLAQLLGLDHIPTDPGPVCRITSPSHRYDIAVVSALAGDQLAARVEEGRAALADTPPGRGRLVVYGGPRFLGPELIGDTAFLHVEEVAEILYDADGDMALWALFILELTEHPGAKGVFYEDALDAWTAWRHHTTFLPPGPDTNDVVVVRAATRDTVWERAAADADTDHVLAGVGLPGVRDFAHARHIPPDAGGRGTYTDLEHVTSQGPLLVRVATVPPLAIVAVPSGHPDSPLGPSAMAGLADALRSRLTTVGALAAHATLPDHAPLHVQLTVTDEPHQPPGTPSDSDAATAEPGERLLLHAGADPQHARIGIDIDPLFLEAFADGSKGHHILGRLLHQLIAEVRLGRDAGPGASADTFTTAWTATHPVLSLATNSWPLVAPAYTVPRTPHLHVRALRTAAAALRRARVPAGSWHGAAAYRRGGPAEQLLQTLESELVDQIRSYEPALLRELARHLNAAWSHRTRSLTQTAVNLRGPWAANWQDEAHRQDAAGATTALQLLLEQALITPPAGDRPADVIAVGELVALAELLRNTGTTAVAASRRLHDLHLDIDPSGLFTLTPAPDDEAATAAAEAEHLGFDASAYHNARQQRMIAAAAATEPTLLDAAVLAHPTWRTETPFTAPDLAPTSQLAHADQLLKQHWGCGFDALGAVLATASGWPTTPDPTSVITPKALVAASASWSGLPTDHLHAAVDRLRLHTDNATGTTDHAYTEVERRRRLLTHPLIAHHEQLLILPWLAHAALEMYGAYLDDRRLPHSDLPAPVAQALLRHRQQLDQHLELEVKNAARAAGLPHRFRLLEKTAAALGVPDLIGEIDLLVADPNTRRLWVIEVKNPTGAVAAHALIQHIQKFTGRYRDKLLDKAATVAAHAVHAAKACGVSDTHAWRVLPLMVTRTTEPSAFIADPHVPYTTADHLTAVLTSPDDPAPGWVAPPERAT